MKCIIYVFSGTGNTRRVAEEYARRLEGSVTAIIDIDRDTVPMHDADADMIGIGYPVHAFNPPHLMIGFARKLAEEPPRPLFIFHTGGEGLHLNDSSSLQLRHILRRYDILSERHYVMPYNMIFRHSDQMARHMLWYMGKLVEIHAKSLMEGIHERYPHMPLRHLISIILRIEWPYASMQGKHMKAGGSCTGCGLCARRCPMQVITMEDGRPVFHTGCILCTRCSMSCPADAISIGLLDGWKVNGPYPLDEIERNPDLKDRLTAAELPRLYRKYYREADKAIMYYETTDYLR